MNTSRRMLKALPFAGLAGLLLLTAALLIGFEEVGTGVVVLSVALMLSVPVGVLLHLSLSADLTPPQKAAWRRVLTGPRALSAMSEYLASDDRAAAIDHKRA